MSQSPAPSVVRHWSHVCSLVLAVLSRRAALASRSTTRDNFHWLTPQLGDKVGKGTGYGELG